jgi:hypothetical protein
LKDYGVIWRGEFGGISFIDGIGGRGNKKNWLFLQSRVLPGDFELSGFWSLFSFSDIGKKVILLHWLERAMVGGLSGLTTPREAQKCLLRFLCLGFIEFSFLT